MKETNNLNVINISQQAHWIPWASNDKLSSTNLILTHRYLHSYILTRTITTYWYIITDDQIYIIHNLQECCLALQTIRKSEKSKNKTVKFRENGHFFINVQDQN